MRANGGFNNFVFTTLEKFPCNTKEEALNREYRWFCEMSIEQTQPTSTINTVRAKAKQYRINNRLTSLMILTNEVIQNELKTQQIIKIYNKLIQELIIFNRLSNPQPIYELQPEPITLIVDIAPTVVEAIVAVVDNPTFEPFQPYVWHPYIFQ